MAFDPSKPYSDNLESMVGTDYYHQLAKKMGGSSSDVWNAKIGELRSAYEGGNMRDSTQAAAWQQKVADTFGLPSIGQGGVSISGSGGITGGGSMANQGDSFKAPVLPSGFDQVKADSQYQATTGTYDESKGVAGRVNELTSAGGALMTAARTRARQAAASRGLLNSSLAGQAGEQAVIESATPIATADAQLYSNQQIANQNAMNAASQAYAAARMQVSLSGLNVMENRRQFDTTTGINQQQFAANLALEKENLAAQREQFAQKLGLDQAQLQLSRDQLSQQDRQFLADLDAKEKQLAQQESQFTRSEANKVNLANIDAQNRKDLMALESTYKQDIEANKNISGAWATMMENINQINNNPDLDASAKQTLIANQQAGFQSFTNFWKKVNGANVDVSDLLNFGPAGQAARAPSNAPAASTRDGDMNGDGRVDWRDQVGGGS